MYQIRYLKARGWKPSLRLLKFVTIWAQLRFPAILRMPYRLQRTGDL